MSRRAAHGRWRSFRLLRMHQLVNEKFCREGWSEALRVAAVKWMIWIAAAAMRSARLGQHTGSGKLHCGNTQC